MMRKKGVELSMNVIIVAAIGLLVLVILAVLVINSTSNVPKTMKACSLQGGLCKASCDIVNGEQQVDNARCDDPTRPTCCKTQLINDVVPGGQ